MKSTAAFIFLICLSVLPLGGCVQEEKVSEYSVPVYPTEPDKDDLEVEMQYREENRVDETFLTEQQMFAFKTAQALLNSREENAVYSPAGFYFALSLAASGTAGDTATELYDFLECAEPETAAENSGRLYRTLYKDNKIAKMHIATSLWADKKLKLNEAFQNQALEQFYASLHSVDFTEAQTAEQMGKWVKEQTKGTIAPVMESAPEQVMSILNTVYFYDQWIERFDIGKTKKDVFHLADGSGKEADFMNRVYGSHGFSKGQNFTRSELGLKENGSMVFVLPDEGVSVEELLKSPGTLSDALLGGESQNGKVTFKVPKFSMDSEFDLKEMMETLGVTKIFSGGDFSAMTERKDLFISRISQNGHIAINEEGVEASAFTKLEYSGAARSTGNAEMILDRPFIYGIVNQGVWLFIGVCDNPA